MKPSVEIRVHIVATARIMPISQSKGGTDGFEDAPEAVGNGAGALRSSHGNITLGHSSNSFLENFAIGEQSFHFVRIQKTDLI